MNEFLRSWFWTIGCIVFSVASSPLILANEPPILRVEARAHTAEITAIATDQGGRLLVTGSKDKSIRIWDPDSGTHLKVLHPILGEGERGEVVAVSLSPDLRLIAAAIRMVTSGFPADAVLVFDRLTGAVVQSFGTERPQLLVQPTTGKLLNNAALASSFAPAMFGIQGLGITRLLFTPDGETLIVGFANRRSGSIAPLGAYAAIRINDWSVQSLPEGMQIQSGGGRSAQLQGTPPLLDLAFDRTGRLLATGLAHPYNGVPTPSIEVFGPQIKPLASIKLPAPTRPARVAVSNDGALVAMGDSGAPQVQVVSQRDFLPIATLTLSTSAPEALVTPVPLPLSLPLVAFSPDSPTLFAAGTSAQGDSTIIRWSDGGKGARLEFPQAGHTVRSIAALPGDRLVFGTEGGAIGVLDASGTRRWLSPPAALGLSSGSSPERIRLDSEGVRVLIPASGERPAAIFSPLDRTLLPVSAEATNAFPPVPPKQRPRVLGSRGGDLIFQNDALSPTLAAQVKNNVHTLSSDSLWAVATASLGGDCFLGTSSSILRVNDKHAVVWSVEVPGGAHQLAVASNGLWLVAGLGDSTLRWYSTSSGELLLSLFVHADLRRWILWSPSGYYDAAAAGEDLIGWYVPRGPLVAPDFYPASRFRATYRRPAVVEGMLRYQSEAEALRRVDVGSSPPATPTTLTLQLPPMLTILSPEPNARLSTSQSPTLTLSLHIRTAPSARVEELRVLVDGRPLAKSALKISPLPRPSNADPGVEAREVSIPLPSQDVLISVLARSRHGWSEPALLPLRGPAVTSPTLTPPTPEFSITPRLFLLAIGISDYNNNSMDLRFAAKDARDFLAAMKLQQDALYRTVESRLLVDQDATRDNLLGGLEWLQRSVTQHDVAMVFIAGHGMNHTDGHYYFLPHNADVQEVKRTLLPDMEVRRTLEALPGKVLMFLDTCHSGNVLGTSQRGGHLATDQNGFVNELMAAENGVIVFTASTGSQASQESEQWQNGVFTRALLEGLSGKADYGNTGRITVNMISLYTSERVNQLTKGTQAPMTARPSTVRDFPVAVVGKK